VKCGSFSGKGHKHTRNGNFEDALNCYQIALSYSDNEGGSAILLECIARSHARLGNIDQALLETNECILKLKNLDCSEPVIKNTKARVAALIDALKNCDKNTINELLNI
jgi:tetratricopeptide (TPR) repeat protein